MVYPNYTDVLDGHQDRIAKQIAEQREIAAAHQYGRGIGAEQCKQAQHAIPRAMELQAFAVKRLVDAASELAKRLEPVMGLDMANKAAGQVACDKAGCPLAETITNHANEIDGATDVLRDILRRLAL